jgi:hypothetical protein
LGIKSPAFTTRFILHTLNNSYFWFKRNIESGSDITDEIRDKILFGLLESKEIKINVILTKEESQQILRLFNLLLSF